MALFGNDQDENHNNQMYADFMGSQNLTQEQLKDLKNGIFEHIKSLHETFENVQKQSANKDSSTSASLTSWAPEIAKIGLLGTLMTLMEKHTRESAASLLALNNYFNPVGSEQKGFTSTDKTTNKEESSKTNELLRDLGIAIKESKPAQVAGGALDELMTLIGLGALAALVVPFIGPLVEWFDVNFGTNIKSKFDNLMEPFQGYVQTVKDTFNKVTDWLEQLITDPKEAFSQAVETIKNIGQYLWQKIKPGFVVVKNVMTGAYEYLKEKLTNYYDQFVNFLAGKPGTSNVFDEAIEQIKGLWESGKSVIQDLSPVLTEVKNIFTSVKKTISDIWDSGIIQSKIEGVMNSLTEKVKSTISNVLDSTSNFLAKFFSDLIDRVLDPIIIKYAGSVPVLRNSDFVKEAKQRTNLREKEAKEKEASRLAEEEAKKRSQLEKEKQRAEAKAKFENEHPELTRMIKEKSESVNELAKHTSESIKEMTEKIVGKLDETKTTVTPPVINAGGGSRSSDMSPIPTSKSNGLDSSRSYYINGKPMMMGF